MIYKIIKFFVVVNILFTTAIYSSAIAQEAEKLFHEKYSKISLVLQPSTLNFAQAFNYDNSTYPSIFLKNSRSLQAGFYYDFAQSGRFNFKTGLIFKELNQKFDLNINSNDLSSNNENALNDFIIGEAFIFSLPFKTECFIPIFPKSNLVIGTGVSFGVITGSNVPTITTISTKITNNVDDYEYQKNFIAITSGAQKGFESEISLGLNYKHKYALIQIDMFYSLSFWQPIIRGEYQIINLLQTEDKYGYLTVYNNFYGMSLSITPKKKWLFKNKN